MKTVNAHASSGRHRASHLARVMLLLIAALFLFLTTGAQAQLSGTYYIPQGANPQGYATIADAITALNTQGVSAPVVFEIAAGYTEAAANLVLNTPATNAPTATNTVIFRKDPATTGANPLITSNASGTGSYDGVIEFNGIDYVTFDAINVSEMLPTPTNALEWGYGIFAASATDASQYIIIKNCVVTLKSATSTILGGIYLRSTLSATGTTVAPSAASGAVSYCEVFGNTVTDAYIGIQLTSSSTVAYYGTGNKIGTGGANTITGFGGSSTTAYGVYGIYQQNLKIENNAITGFATGHTTTGYGIFVSTGTSSNTDITSNTITLTTAATTSATYGISCAAGSTPASNTTNITYNTVQGCSGTATTSGNFYGVHNTGSAATLNMTNNQIINNTWGLTASTSTTYYWLYNSGAAGQTANISNNTISNNSAIGPSGTMYGMYLGTSALSVHDNQIYSNGYTAGSGSSACTVYGIYDAASPTSEAYYNNSVHDLTITTSSSSTGHIICGIYQNTVATSTRNVYGNQIYNLVLNSSGTGYGTVTGIISAAGGTVGIYKNTIHGLTAQGSNSTCSGITVSSGTTNNVYNNYITELSAPNSTNALAVNGLNLTGGTTTNAYYNSVHVNASSSSATLFGSNAVYASTTPTLTLRNNILVNQSSAGTATAANSYHTAYRRSSPTLTTYSTSSNTNCFWVDDPTADTTRAIYYEAASSNTKRTFADYKSFMATRDQASVFELPPFMNTMSTPYDLHIDPGQPTQCESGGVRITSPAITTDWDGDIRQGEAGYAGMGSAPDIGADEGDFMPSDLTGPAIAYSPLPNIPATATAITLTATITDASGVNVNPSEAPRLYYRRSTAVAPSVINANDFMGNGPTDDGWKYVEATLPPAGTTYQFSLDPTLLYGNPPGSSFTVGDVIQYFVIASDIVNNLSIQSGTLASMPPTVDLNSANAPVTGTISSFTVVASLSGTYTIGGGTPAGTYTTLKAFFDDVNTKVVTGNLTAQIVSNTTETAPASVNAWSEYPAGSLFSMTIKPAASTTPTISGSFSTTSPTGAGAVIVLNGADRVTIDGSNTVGGTTRDLTVQNTITSGTTAVIHVGSLGNSLGATNNVIKNTNIVGGLKTLSTSYGIYVGGTAVGTTGADNDVLTIQNNMFNTAYQGVYINGSADPYKSDFITITGNEMGSNTDAASLQLKGVFATNATNVTVTDNHIFNMTSLSIYHETGVHFGAGVTTNCLIARNRIHKLIFGTSSTSGYGTRGIHIETGSAAAGITIANNLIYDLLGDGYTTITGSSVAGIYVYGTNGGLNIWYNSINLYGTQPKTTTGYLTTGVYFASTSTNINFRNNIIANAIAQSAASWTSYAVYSEAVGTAFTPIDNNCYYTPGAYGKVGYIGSTARTTLAEWRTGTGQDGNSVAVDPMFTASDNLTINYGTTQSPLESSGATVAVTTDYLSQTRPFHTGTPNGGGLAPDMGAYEFDGVPLVPMVYTSSTSTGVTGFCTPGGTSTLILGVQVVMANAGSPLSITQLDFNSTGTTTLTDISNAKLWYTGTSPSFAATTQFGTTVASVPATFSFTGAQTLDPGTNYFWLTYDVAAGATTGNAIDAGCDQIYIGATNHIPTVTSPPEYRTVQGPLNGTFTVGTGGNFPTLTDAFSHINAQGLSGNVELSIIGTGHTLPGAATLNQWTETPPSSNYTLLIKPAAGATPTIAGTVGGALIKLNGADRVTFDGSNTVGGSTRDLTFTNNQTALGTQTVINIASLGAGLGCNNVTVKNCRLIGGHLGATSNGIAVCGTNATTAGDDNDNITLQNNLIERNYIGIFCQASSATTMYNNILIKDNTIGSNTPADYVVYRGLSLAYLDNASVVEGNEVFNITMSYAGPVVGIDVGSYCAGLTVRKNRVHNIYNQYSSGTGYSAYGINLSSSATGTAYAGIRIENNMVWDVNCYGGGSAGTSYSPVGIRIGGGTGHIIVHNSVNMTGAMTHATVGGSAALMITSTSYNAHDIRNNIFANSMTGPTGHKSWAVYFPSSYAFATTTINANDYYPSGTFGVLGYNGADVTSLPSWKTATAQDAGSYSTNPLFTSATDLHINAGTTPFVLESGGVALTPAVGVDIDGDTRPGPAGSVNGGATAPDMGADEFDGVPPLPMTYTSSAAVAVSGRTSPGSTTVGVQGLKVTMANQFTPLSVTDITFNTAPSGLPTTAPITNAKIWFTGNSSTFAATGQFGTTVATPSGSHTVTGTQQLMEGDNYFWVTYDVGAGATTGQLINAEFTGLTITTAGAQTPSPTTTGTGREVLGALSGTFTVGTGGDFADLTAVFTHINAQGLVGNTTLSIVSNQTLSASAILNQWTETPVGSNYTLLIKPAASQTPVISGAIAGNLVLINGADRVTIDGSNTVGGTTRDLTFSNTYASGTQTAIQVAGTAAGAGATYFTLKNCRLRTGHIGSGAYILGVGGSTGGSSGYDNDNCLIENNLLEKGYYGMYLYGSTSGYHDNMIVRNNTIGSTTSTDYVAFKGMYLYAVPAPLIEGNDVFSMIMSTSSALVGIDISNYTAGATIRKNRVHGLNNTNSGGYGAYGINIISTTTGNGHRIENNMIYDIMTYGDPVSTTYNPVGIRLAGGTGHLVYHNSVYLTGATTVLSGSMALLLTSTSYNAHDIRNNIFANAINGNGGASYCVYVPSGYAFATTTFNYNDYFPSGATAYVGYSGTADVPTLSGWQTLTGQDAGSISVDPMFTSATNLHISSGTTPMFLESGGASGLGVTTDIDGDTRPGPTGSVNGGGTAPDIGADEWDGFPPPQSFVSSTTVGTSAYVSPNTTDNKVIAIQVVASGSASPLTVSQIDLNTTGTTLPGDITNAKIFFTGTSPTFATTSQYGSTVVGPSGAYTITGSQTLSSGTNYFWLAYDVAPGAATGNILDAQCTSITVGGTPRIPTQTAPPEFLTVLDRLTGSYNVGTGQIFTSIKSAFDAANNVGLQGNTTFLITSNQTLTTAATLNQWTEYGGSGYTLTVKPSTTGLTIDGTIAGGLLILNGADRVTIDGAVSGSSRDLTIANTSTSGNAGAVVLTSLGTGLGATNNTIRNCVLRSGHIASGAVAISVGGAFGTSGDDNENTTIENNLIEKSYYGMYVAASSAGTNQGLLIKDNTIGSTTATNYVVFKGMYLFGCDAAVIEGNDVFSQILSYSGALVGIEVSSYCANSIVRKNRVHGMNNSSSSGYGAYGINLIGTSVGDNIRIENNMIYDILTYGDPVGTSYDPIGIRIAGGIGHQIYHNSVYLSGTFTSTSACGSMALAVTSSSYNNLDIRNNIFANAQVGPASSKCYAIYMPSSWSWTGSTINANDYFPSGTYGVLGYNGSADVTSLAAWKAWTTQDALSISTDPAFQSTTNLHINNAAPSALESAGAAIGVTSDIDGDVRPGPTGSVNGGAIAADMGADEFDGIPLGMVYASSTTTGFSGLIAPAVTDARIIGIEVVTTNVLNPLTLTQFALNTTGTTSAADIANAKIFYTGSSSTFAPTNQFGSTYPSPSGTYTISGSQVLESGTNYFWLAYDLAPTAPTGNFIDGECTQVTVGSTPYTPTVTAPTGYFTVQAPFNGAYTIGTGGTYTTLKAAFDILSQVGMTGNTTFNIISDVTETAMASLSQWPNIPSSSTFTLTIQPDGGVPRTVSYAVAAGESVIRLNGADNVIIDGLNTGGNALTIATTGTNGTSAPIWLASLGTGLGCNNVTIRNTTLTGTGNTVTTSFGLYLGGTTISTTGTGADNDNATIQGNTIGGAYYGIYASGASGGTLGGLQILNNTIGTATSGIGSQGVALGYSSGALISGNEVAGVLGGSAVTNQVGIIINTGAAGTLIRKNRIHDFNYNSTSGYGATGIRYLSDATATSEISNNLIWNIRGDGDNITSTNYTYMPIGIAIGSGGSINIWHNSVYMTGTLAYQTGNDGTSACILAAAGVTGLDIRNNIFQNGMNGTAGLSNKAYGIVFQGTTLAVASALSNNVYYLDGTTNISKFVGFYNANNYSTLGAWQTGTSLDANSYNGDPRFTSTTDLSINTTTDPAPMGSNIGMPVTVTDDILGTARNTGHPDAGAYEIDVNRVFNTPGTYALLGGGVYDNITVSDPGAAVTMSDDVYVGVQLDITSGSLDLGGNTLALFGGVTLGTGTLVSSPGSTLAVLDPPIGTGSPAFTMPPLSLYNLTLSRAAGMSLSGDATLMGTVTLVNGNIRLGSFNFTLGSAALILGTPSASAMFVPTGTGQLRRTIVGYGTSTFPVGDETGTAEYSPITLTFQTGTFGASAWAGVSLENVKHPNNGSTTDFLARYWHVAQNDITGFTCDVTGTYTVADVNGTEANIWTGKYDGAWTKLNAVNTGTHQISGTGLTSFSDFTGAEDGIFSSLAFVVNAKAFLEGAWDGVSAMTTWLPTDPTFPLTQPYSGLPWSYTGTESVLSVPANVVDWVLVEVRDATLPSTIISRRAGFILSDGSIVDTDGTSPLAFATGTAGSYHVAIWHRNHIPVMSAAAIPLTPTSALYNFTTDQTQGYGFDPMKQLGTGIYGLIGGDATADQFIDGNDFNDADANQWNSGYLLYDTNLDAFIDGNDFNIPDANQWQGSQLP